MVLLYNTDWNETHYIVQADLKLRDPPASTSCVLKLRAFLARNCIKAVANTSYKTQAKDWVTDIIKKTIAVSMMKGIRRLVQWNLADSTSHNMSKSSQISGLTNCETTQNLATAVLLEGN